MQHYAKNVAFVALASNLTSAQQQTSESMDNKEGREL